MAGHPLRGHHPATSKYITTTMSKIQKSIVALLMLAWALAALSLFLTGCATTHTEQFHGDKDSVNYFRHGSVEWRYKL